MALDENMPVRFNGEIPVGLTFNFEFPEDPIPSDYWMNKGELSKPYLDIKYTPCK
jgi:hypothetical protein